MQGYNVIAVYNTDGTKLLMCKRRKNPYKGLLNLVGGKIEAEEDGLHAAYRELAEETGIPKEAITLTHVMNFTYPQDSCYLEAYVGRLNKDVPIHGDENELLWLDLPQDFFDVKRFAGVGNIGHILQIAEMNQVIK